VKWIFEHIGKGFLTALGALLLGLIGAIISKLAKWVFDLDLTDKEVLTIRLGLAFFGLALLGLIGWIRFSRARRELRETERKLREVCVSLERSKMVNPSPPPVEPQISQNALALLRVFYDAGFELSPDHIHSHSGANRNDVMYVLDELVRHGLIKHTFFSLPGDPSYEITEKGRIYYNNHK
jgi:hypothetical protein